jgi:hypothetical protein
MIEFLDWVGRYLSFIFVGATALAAFFYIKLFYKKERRLMKNLSRPVLFYHSKGGDFTIEKSLLEASDFFKIDKASGSNTTHVVDSLSNTNCSLVIAGFDANDREHFYQVFDKAKAKRLPIIVYTFGRNAALTSDDWDKLNTYSFYSIVNAPLRLLNDAFAILSTFPEK